MQGNKLASRFAVLPFFWLPLGAFPSMYRQQPRENIWIYFFYFALIYLVFTLLLYVILRKVIELKKTVPSTNAVYLSLLVIFTQTIILGVLYTVDLFTSWWSLFITLPVSLSITFATVIIMTRKKSLHTNS